MQLFTIIKNARPKQHKLVSHWLVYSIIGITVTVIGSTILIYLSTQTKNQMVLQCKSQMQKIDKLTFATQDLKGLKSQYHEFSTRMAHIAHCTESANCPVIVLEALQKKKNVSLGSFLAKGTEFEMKITTPSNQTISAVINDLTRQFAHCKNLSVQSLDYKNENDVTAILKI